MSFARIQTDTPLIFDQCLNLENITDPVDFLRSNLRKILRWYVLFNLFFLFLFVAETTTFFYLFNTLHQSSILSISLAIIFFTVFGYFIFRLLYQSQKVEHFYQLIDQFSIHCLQQMKFEESSVEYHIEMAHAFLKAATSLHREEYKILPTMKWVKFLGISYAKFSRWFYWFDLHQVKELLLLSSIEEYITLIKSEPSNLDFHAGLANAYVMLSGIYSTPLSQLEEGSWLPNKEFIRSMRKKFQAAAKKAIEEFKILNEYAPNDPWTHRQLAYSYRDLQMPKEELKEYETLFALNPQDYDILYKLGTIYFEQGKNAKGLRVYEKLKKKEPKKAEALIKHYT